MPTDGMGPHRIWYVGGRYAYASIHFADFTDHVLAVIDMSDPRKPQVVGRCWLPGMWRAGGETPTAPAGKRYALHHALLDGDIAYAAWRDGGLTVINVADPAGRKSWCTARRSRAAAARIRRCRCRTASCSSSPTSRPSPTARKAGATSGPTTCASRPIRR